MNSVYLLQHLHILNGDEENVKCIGIYSTRENALAAVDRFRRLPGFSAVPELVDPMQAESPEGFYIDEYVLNQDSWSEGFETV